MVVSVKDRTCPRIARPTYCFAICGSIFSVLFGLLDRNIYQEVKPSDKAWKFFQAQIEIWWHFLMENKKASFFLGNCTLVWSEIWLDDYLFNYLLWLPIQLQLRSFIWFNYPLTLNYPLEYGQKLSNIIARLAAAMYTFVAWVISWGMWVYNTTQGFRFVPCYWYKGCNILTYSQMKLYLYFCIFHSHLGIWWSWSCFRT